MPDITVTLGTGPDLDAEERRQRALRAREVLASAGWAFDEVISALTRDLLGTTPDESAKRESLYHQIDAAAQLKGHLSRIIQLNEAEKVAHDRRNQNTRPADAE